MKGAGELIRETVLSWPGVEAVPHRFGGMEYRFGRKEMGHVHGDRLADLPLPRKLHDEVIAAGKAGPHHVLPDTGWVSCWMAGPEDAPNVIDLFRIQYERYAASNRTRRAAGLHPYVFTDEPKRAEP
jgi:Family of unknown function (DUF5519)